MIEGPGAWLLPGWQSRMMQDANPWLRCHQTAYQAQPTVMGLLARPISFASADRCVTGTAKGPPVKPSGDEGDGSGFIPAPSLPPSFRIACGDRTDGRWEMNLSTTSMFTDIRKQPEKNCNQLYPIPAAKQIAPFNSSIPIPFSLDVEMICGKAAGRLAMAVRVSVSRRLRAGGLILSALVRTS